MAATDSHSTGQAVVPTPQDGAVRYVDWPAIFAGTVVASAIALVLTSFGSAIGLSFVDFDEGTPGTGLTIGLGLWSVWALVTSFMAGAYLTGRLRHRVPGATEHEADIRDGAHGLAVWGLGVLVGALLFAMGATTTARIGAEAVSGATSAVASAGSEAAGALDELDYERLADRLLRPSGEAVPASATRDREAAGTEVGRILQGSGEGGIGDDDQEYLASLVAERTGLSEEEAAARVERVAGALQELRREALDAAEAARQTAVLGAFVLAASLLVAGAGAWWAAGMGGQHRDEGTIFASFGRRR